MKPVPKINELLKHLAVGSVAALGAAMPVGLGLMGQVDEVTRQQMMLAAFGVGATVVSGVMQGRLGNVVHEALAPPKQPDYEKILNNHDLHKLTGDALALVMTGFQDDPRVSQESTREALTKLAAKIQVEWNNLGATPGFSQAIRSLSNEELREWTVQMAQGKVPSAINHLFWDVLLQSVIKKHEINLPDQVRQGLAQAIVKEFPHHVRQLLKEGGRAFNGHLMDWLGAIWSELKAGREENRGLHERTYQEVVSIKNRLGNSTPAIAHPFLPPADWEQRVFVGRTSQKDQMKGFLLAPLTGTKPKSSVAYLAGMPGIGKTWLAEWFGEYPWREAHRTQTRILRYPLVYADDVCQTTRDDLLRWLCDVCKVPFGTAETAEWLAASVQNPGLLLHLDNVDDAAAAEAVGGFLGQLSGCTALVTGREQQFGQSRGWKLIPVAELSLAEAVAQLKDELALSKAARIPGDSELDSLARQLGHLPLALHLAAGHLALGLTCAEFLRELTDSGLAMLPADRGDERLSSNRARAILDASFELSWRAFGRRSDNNQQRWCAALAALGHAPLVGFGRSLGAAIAGLEEAEFTRTIRLAHEFSLVMPFHDARRPEGAWRIHPLLATWLCQKCTNASPEERMTEWFQERLKGPVEDKPLVSRWNEVIAEYEAFAFWLGHLSIDQIPGIVRVAGEFALYNGPFSLWFATAARALAGSVDPESRSWLLSLSGHMALFSGDSQKALELANETINNVRKHSLDGDLADALGLKAFILWRMGNLDEALSIWRDEKLPIVERCGDVPSQASTKAFIAGILLARGESDEALRMLKEEALALVQKLGMDKDVAVYQGRIADVLQARGDLAEALRIRRDEQLPVYERLGYWRDKAVVLGKIADILVRRRNSGDLDEAFRIRHLEQLPVFASLGDVRERALTMGKIACIKDLLGDSDEAVRLCREEQIPVLERISDIRSLVLARKDLAVILIHRDAASDRTEASHLLMLALEAAEKLRIPEAEQIREIRRSLGMERPG